MSSDLWYAYVLVSLEVRGPRSWRVARTYVGVAIDVDRRVRQHNGELSGGARSTRAGRPWRVAVVYGPFRDRAQAQTAEHALKRLRGPAARLAPVLAPPPPRE